MSDNLKLLPPCRPVAPGVRAAARRCSEPACWEAHRADEIARALSYSKGEFAATFFRVQYGADAFLHHSWFAPYFIGRNPADGTCVVLTAWGEERGRYPEPGEAHARVAALCEETRQRVLRATVSDFPVPKGRGRLVLLDGNVVGRVEKYTDTPTDKHPWKAFRLEKRFEIHDEEDFVQTYLGCHFGRDAEGWALARILAA